MSLVYMYIRPYSAQEDLTEEKPTRTLKCKKAARGQRCLLAKRESLFSLPLSVFFSLLFNYLSIFHPPYSYQLNHIRILPVLCFSSLRLYSVPLVMSRYHFVTREWSHELHFVTRLSWIWWKTKSFEETVHIIEITKSYANTFRSIFLSNVLMQLAIIRMIPFSRLYIYLQTLRYILYNLFYY